MMWIALSATVVCAGRASMGWIEPKTGWISALWIIAAVGCFAAAVLVA